MGKVKIDFYCYLTADIVTKVVQKWSLSSPPPNISFLSNPLNLIGCHDSRKSKFAKNIQKYVFYYRCLICIFVAMATYSFHWFIMGKMKIGIYCYFVADILTKSFSEMFIEWFSTQHIILVLTSQFDWLSTKGLNLRKYLKKSTPQKLYCG